MYRKSYQDLNSLHFTAFSDQSCFSFSGLEKINFSGGEPFIHKRGEFLGELTRYCKRDLGLDSVTIVCNGSLVTEKWFAKYGKHSCSSAAVKKLLF